MDASGIKQIEATAIEAAKANQVVIGNQTLIFKGKDDKLYTTEQYQALRSRFRGQFETTSINDFVKHVNKQVEANDDVHMFINQESFVAQAIYNYGTKLEPGHCDDTAVLIMKETAAFRALKGVNGVKLSQKQMIEFIEDWNAMLTPYDGEENTFSLAAAVQGIRAITIASKGETTTVVGDLKQKVGSFHEIEAKSETIPAGFNFSLTPYTGLSRRHFSLRLSVLTTAAEPVLVMRIVGFETEIEDLVGEFKSLLTDLIDDKVSTYIGVFAAR